MTNGNGQHQEKCCGPNLKVNMRSVEYLGFQVCRLNVTKFAAKIHIDVMQLRYDDDIYDKW